MKNSMDFSKIEINGKLLGVLNFNLMIPVEEEQLQLVDTTIFKRDRGNIKYYKQLCVQELEWCQINSEVICNKANVLYKKYISNEPFTGRDRCLNFSKLEAECEKYNSQERERKDRDYPKVCVNLQTGVRYNYPVWRFYYGKKKRQPTKSGNEGNDA